LTYVTQILRDKSFYQLIHNLLVNYDIFDRISPQTNLDISRPEMNNPEIDQGRRPWIDEPLFVAYFSKTHIHYGPSMMFQGKTPGKHPH
jgi:hypothetical protein